LIGEIVNNYQIVSILGEGGMGAVYLAEHPFMGRKAAIKVLRRELSEDGPLVARFMSVLDAAGPQPLGLQDHLDLVSLRNIWVTIPRY
jgi:eukaryotic-like serine/threonine-protein kinase